MRLAEALLEKKATTTRIADLQSRFLAAAVIENGTVADEGAIEMFESFKAGLDRQEELTVAINRTNNVVVVETGGVPRTMMQALARRDSLKIRIHYYNLIVASLRQQSRRYYNADGPKLVLAEGISALTFIKMADDLAKEFRLLDAQIQAANWANDLIEV